MERVILHSDINNCYASIECRYRPDLAGLPVAVGGDEAARHGIVLAKNEQAKACGVTTGEPLWQARQKCPGLLVLPPHFDRYVRFSRMVRAIYADYTDRVEPFGLDEAWLDVSGSVGLLGSGRQMAEQIRQRVKRELGITVSVGVCDNKIFAKLASDLKKPDAVTQLCKEQYPQQVFPLPTGALFGVGRATAGRLARYGITTIGSLAGAQPAMLHRLLGKPGLLLHRWANGWDDAPVLRAQESPLPKSVGNGVTTPRDLVGEEEVRAVLWMLAQSVATRMREKGLAAGLVQVSVKDSDFHSSSHQASLVRQTDLAGDLCREAMALLCRHYDLRRPIRSVTLQAACLAAAVPGEQTSLFESEEHRARRAALERTVDQLRSRYGRGCVDLALCYRDPTLRGLPVHEETPNGASTFLRA